jgi:hypothetical protein
MVPSAPEIPLRNVEGNTVQNRDGKAFPVIGLGEVPDFHDGSFGFSKINSTYCNGLSLQKIIADALPANLVSSPWLFLDRTLSCCCFIKLHRESHNLSTPILV